MLTLPRGTRGSFTMVVSAEHLASRFKDPTLPPVLATPVMILAMENAALEALKPFLKRGESAVGSHVDVKHLAATPVGATVTATATVIEVSGRRIVFSVHASDGRQDIGSGTHERVLIDMARFSARLAAATTRDAGSTPGPAG
jgi:fluoroacetyl-CoA thioesterase